jgi:C4-type Zn-finger protein
MTGVTGDIVELLKRWDRWRRIDETPERVDALEKRIAELESKLQRAPGQACPSCGALEFRVISSNPSAPPFGQLGARDHTYKCQSCGFQDVRHVSPSGR